MDQSQDHGTAAMAALELPEEDWDKEPMLPTGLSDREQIVNLPDATEGNDT